MLTFASTWKSMPTAGLEVIWGLPPIHLHLCNVALNTYGRIHEKISHTHIGTPGCEGHLDVLKTTFLKLGLNRPMERIHRRAQAQLFKMDKTLDNKEDVEYKQVYTGGSKIEGLAGCGYFMQDKLTITHAKIGRAHV